MLVLEIPFFLKMYRILLPNHCGNLNGCQLLKGAVIIPRGIMWHHYCITIAQITLSSIHMSGNALDRYERNRYVYAQIAMYTLHKRGMVHVRVYSKCKWAQNMCIQMHQAKNNFGAVLWCDIYTFVTNPWLTQSLTEIKSHTVGSRVKLFAVYSLCQVLEFVLRERVVSLHIYTLHSHRHMEYKCYIGTI